MSVRFSPRALFYDDRYSRFLAWLLPLLVLALWELFVDLRLLPVRILPAPSSVLAAFARLTSSGELGTHLRVSFQRAALGFVIGGGVGLALGFANGLSRVSEVLLDSPMQMLRNVPHLALLPIVILWFGIGEESKVFLVALGAVFPIYVNTFHGIRAIDPGLLELARVYQVPRRKVLTDIVLPGALPSVLLGVRYALGITWLTLIVAETIAARSGIGFMAMNAREFLETEVVVLSILLYALFGKAADSIARLLERTFLQWHHAQRGESQRGRQYGLS
jgi:sulfonate transport system permease protein